MRRKAVSCNTCRTLAHLVVVRTRIRSKGELSTAQAHNSSRIISGPDDVRCLRNSLLKSQHPQLCYTCHGTVQAQFALPVHHRVPEGSMKCTDCHNTHGTPNAFNLVRTVTETCTQCHVEKHGPFVYEHPAGKLEGCVTCHNPHGSVNRMIADPPGRARTLPAMSRGNSGSGPHSSSRSIEFPNQR